MTRAQRSFWVLTALAILTVGSVAQALAAPAGAWADVRLGVSLLLLIVTGTLLVRVLPHLSRRDMG